MADLRSPEPPPEQMALRALVEHLLTQYEGVATYRHDDIFWESASGREAEYGWGTRVAPLQSGKPFLVWFDGLDHDIAVSSESSGWRRKNRGVWFEWRDLSDMDAVLGSVEERLRSLLAGFA